LIMGAHPSTHGLGPDVADWSLSDVVSVADNILQAAAQMAWDTENTSFMKELDNIAETYDNARPKTQPAKRQYVERLRGALRRWSQMEPTNAFLLELIQDLDQAYNTWKTMQDSWQQDPVQRRKAATNIQSAFRNYMHRKYAPGGSGAQKAILDAYHQSFKVPMNERFRRRSFPMAIAPVRS
jgi:hypothetical protein